MISGSPPVRLRMGVLGCADIARRRTIPAMTREPLLRLVAVASRDGGKAREFAAGLECEAVEGYQKLLDRNDIDAVYIPLPTALHAEWAAKALEAGKHVLVEKPMTLAHAQTSELLLLARKRRRLLMENFMFTHHSQHEAVRELIADGAIGEVRAFAATFAIPPRPAGDIRLRPELGGGALLDVGVYPVRAAQLFLGPGLRVIGAVLRHDLSLGVELSGAALLRGESDIPAQLTFGMENAYRSCYEISGSTGRLTLDRAFTPPADHRPVVRLERSGRIERMTLPADDQFANIIRAFARSALDGVSTDASGDLAVSHSRLIDEIRALAPR